MEPLAPAERRSDVQLRRLPATMVAPLVVALTVLTLLALGTSPAAAATTLEVDAGYAGSYRPGVPMPVRVRIAADRLLRGALEVQVGGGFGDTVTVVVPVEAPGGTVKEVVVVAPTNHGDARATVVASLRQDEAEVARGTASAVPTGDQELVGLLAGVLGGRDAPAVTPLTVDAGTARFSALGPAELAAAPASLAGLDVVAAAPDDLVALDEATQAGLMRWVAGGGHLLVDSPPGAAIAGLPPAWQPDGRNRVSAGLGEVRITDGAMAAGNWAAVVEPTPITGQPGSSFSGFGLDGVLATDAGLRIPRLGWLVGFLAVYVLVAVPLTLTVLRRRGRGELGWIALPVVALGFTAASYGAGREARGDTTVAHATVIHTSEGGALATTSVGIVSADGGRIEVGYPRRWIPAGRSLTSGGPPAQLRNTLGPEGIAISQQLDVGQFGVHRASGPIPLEGRLEVTATATGATTLEGLVRNTMPFALDEVAVLQDQSATAIGRLEPGEERAWSLRLVANDPFPGPAARMWPEASGFNAAPDIDSVVAFPLWGEFEASAGVDVLAPGTVVAAGWTREFVPPLDLAGTAPASGRTLVTGTSVVGSGAATSGGPGLLGPEVLASIVRAPFLNGGAFDERAPVVFRLLTPPVVAGSPPLETTGLVIRAPEVVALEVWSDGAWNAMAGGTAARDIPIPVPPPGGPGFGMGGPGPAMFGPLAEHALPPAALHDGAVWVRARAGGFGVIDPYTLATASVVALVPAP